MRPRRPIRRSILCPIVATALLVCGFEANGAEPASVEPQWIWSGADRHRPQQARFVREFSVSGDVERAVLSAASDFANLRITLNDRLLGEIESYGPPRAWNARAALRPGENRLTVEATSVPGPAAYCLTLTITYADRTTQTIVSDESWSVLKSARGDFEKVGTMFGSAARDTWTSTTADAAISPFDDYEQWRQALGTGETADPSKFSVPAGFEIELVRAARGGEGSWIGLACDPQGRFVIGREDKGLLRVTLPSKSAKKNSEPKVETINDVLEENRGLLFAHDSLYVSANASKAIYRLRDLDGDDHYETVDKLIDLPGSEGHGRNSLAFGPDGRIYAICGDAVQVPKNIADRTSPLAEHRHVEKTNEGFLLAFDAAGKEFEIIATGLRNPYGVAFDERGEPFTYDADAEKDMGQAWYRPTRVLHLASGADFGWRGVTGQWPPYYPDHPDNGVPTLDIGKGSPTAVLFGYASNFRLEYREALYLLDWSYGRIVKVDVTPRGAGYAAHAETFVKGRPFNVTSLAFGRDGAMYVVTGGRKTQSGLYRIRYVGPTYKLPGPTPQQLARAEQGETAHALRRRLEQVQYQPGTLKLDEIWPHLGDADPVIRYAARTALEHLPRQAWTARALAEKQPLAALTALSALMRSGEPALAWPVTASLDALPWLDGSETERATAAYLYLQAFEHGRLSDDKRAAAAKRLDSIFPANSPALDSLVSRALAKVESPTLVEKALNLLASAETENERIHYLFVLRDVKTGWTEKLRERYFAELAAARGLPGGEGMPQTYRRIVDDALAALPEAERERYAAIVAPKPQAEDSAPLVVTRPTLRTWRFADEPEILAAGDYRPNLDRGREMFAAALCIRCHRFGTTGSAVGPDLTGLARRFSRRDMLESILVPSKVVAEQYRTVQIETSDGRVIVGRLVAEEDFRSKLLHIATNPLDPRQVVEIIKKDIASHTTTPTSLMPENLLNTLTKEEILDLLAYLETSGL
jgi:putative heme-binding domain-containing protein